MACIFSADGVLGIGVLASKDLSKPKKCTRSLPHRLSRIPARRPHHQLFSFTTASRFGDTCDSTWIVRQHTV